MNPLMTVGQHVFNWTWKTSLQAAVLVVLVLLLQRLLGRWLTPRMRYALSFLVLCRLLVPAAPSSSLSLENLFVRTTQPAQSVVIATAVASPVQESSPRIHLAAFPLAAALGVGWFCGLIALTCVAGWQYRRWRRLIRTGKHLSDSRLIEILDAARKAMGVRRPVTLVSVAQLSSPAVFGFWRVRVLLPQATLPRLSAQEWRLVFMHEMAHVRNNDSLLNIILIAVQFLHWFNPLVWLGLRRLRADRELVCDALVLKHMEPSDHLGYAQVLLKLAEAISLGPQVFSSAVPVVSARSEIKTRILAIKHYREPSPAAGLATIVLVLTLGCLTFTRARDADPQSEGRGESGADATDKRSVLLGPEMAIATNGAMVVYGQTVLTADRVTADPEKGQVVADGHVGIQQGENTWNSEHLTYNFLTNQAPSLSGVAEIGIRYLGPQLVKESDIRAKIHVQAGKPYSPAAVDDDVRNLYATGLFYNIHASSESTPEGIKLTYIVQCNLRLVEVKFTGNSKFSQAQLLKRISSRIGESFNERNLFQDSQAIQDMYEKAGYKGTEVKYSYKTDPQPGKATATFAITEPK